MVLADHLNARSVVRSAIFAAACTFADLRQPAAEDRILPSALVCDFQSENSAYGRIGEWERSDPGGNLQLTFAGIDRSAQTAQVIGNLGAEMVTLVVGDWGLTFIEVTPVGNVQTATVLLGPPKMAAPDDRLPAVYSRHSALLGEEIVVSQYTGFCQARY